MSESRDPAGDSTTTNNMGEVREAEHQGAAVKAALGANIGVAIAKLLAAFFTGSSAMLSESVHSIADCSNEIVLMVGGRFSKRKTDGDHPFGLYRAKYLASFVVATLLFFVGGFFSTSEAVKKLVAISADPALCDVNRMELLVAFIVVVISACLEGFGLHQSIKEANERMERTNTKHMGVFRFWRRTKSAELASVIMEDTLALIGLAFAGLGIGLAIRARRRGVRRVGRSYGRPGPDRRLAVYWRSNPVRCSSARPWIPIRAGRSSRRLPPRRASNDC